VPLQRQVQQPFDVGRTIGQPVERGDDQLAAVEQGLNRFGRVAGRVEVRDLEVEFEACCRDGKILSGVDPTVAGIVAPQHAGALRVRQQNAREGKLACDGLVENDRCRGRVASRVDRPVGGVRQHDVERRGSPARAIETGRGRDPDRDDQVVPAVDGDAGGVLDVVPLDAEYGRRLRFLAQRAVQGEEDTVVGLVVGIEDYQYRTPGQHGLGELNRDQQQQAAGAAGAWVRVAQAPDSAVFGAQRTDRLGLCRAAR
jgi:hypothetical protein